MEYVLLAPHSDDESLFASYILQRLKPIKVIIVTDGTSHQKNFGIPIEQRREESKIACSLIDVPVRFLGIPEELLTLSECIKRFQEIGEHGTVIAPAKQGGHPHHDIISEAARLVFSGNILYYSTYTKDSLFLAGEMAVTPTNEERRFKELMLDCYKSQLKINPHHFLGVKGSPEYLNLKQHA